MSQPNRKICGVGLETLVEICCDKILSIYNLSERKRSIETVELESKNSLKDEEGSVCAWSKNRIVEDKGKIITNRYNDLRKKGVIEL